MERSTASAVVMFTFLGTAPFIPPAPGSPRRAKVSTVGGRKYVGRGGARGTRLAGARVTLIQGQLRRAQWDATRRSPRRHVHLPLLPWTRLVRRTRRFPAMNTTRFFRSVPGAP